MQLVGSADTTAARADGNFGNLGEGGLGSTGSGFNIYSNSSNSTVKLYYTTDNGKTYQPADASHPSGTRLVLTLKSGITLPADYYRVYLPNAARAGQH